MNKTIIVLAAAGLLFSCNAKKQGKKFEVSGTVTNSPAKVIYLDELPMATMQRLVADSSPVDKNGKFSLKAVKGEAKVYSLRMENYPAPVADIINDADKITLDITFAKDAAYVEKYDVKGSGASGQLKDFLLMFNRQLQSIYQYDLKHDSLVKANAPDSLLAAMDNEKMNTASQTEREAKAAINKFYNPALTMIQLGYYQNTAKQLPVLGLNPVSDEEVVGIINTLYTKFPGHEGLSLLKYNAEQDIYAKQKGTAGNWVGKQAPEIALPDVNGKQVKLSSYKGKYVLVDFWASWCGPCRMENPNVVAAYNKFKGRNFDILGVSLDNPGEREKWLNAITKDKLTWAQVSDLQGWESVVVPAYGFGELGIPYNVLVDPQGKIIAEALRGPALDAKLEEVLK